MILGSEVPLLLLVAPEFARSHWTYAYQEYGLRILEFGAREDQIETAPPHQSALIYKNNILGISWQGQFLSQDFCRGPLGFQARRKVPRSSLLGKALGSGACILDLAMGLGGDAWMMLNMGYRVESCERYLPVYLVVEDAVHRWLNYQNTKDTGPNAAPASIPKKLSWVRHLVDARDFLANSKKPIETVYMDLMFSKPNAKALPNLAMQVLRNLLSHNILSDTENISLFNLAREVASKRVVVKRALREPPLAPRPTHSFSGKSVRYDLYS